MNPMTEGQRLARSLASFVDDHPIVLGIPRGGIRLADQVARALGAPLDVLIAGKVCAADGTPFAGVAAGSALLEERAVFERRLSDPVIERLLREERIRQAGLLARIRGSWALPALEDRSVILVDDAVITGLTMRAAIAAVEGRGARRVVIATPLCATTASAELATQVHYMVRLITLPDAIAADLHVRGSKLEPPLDDDGIRARIAPPLGAELLDGNGSAPPHGHEDDRHDLGEHDRRQ